ncbi:ATP-binding protein, partial [Methylotenera sp.]|uniref:ATP-binding protein n=1 Tax=Methylotenera sp. TaxID=2051956 RepID=UPI0027336BE7
SGAKESAKAISDVTRQMMDMVREILQRLRPRVLDELGLGLALDELMQQWRQRSRNVRLTHNITKDLGVLDEAVSITAYRVVQECLTNIVKHADARQVAVYVTQDAQYIYIKVEDDGVGFDTTLAAQGYGLAGMSERIQGLMGDMNIETSNNQGTRIMVTLPKQAPAGMDNNNGLA